MLSCCACEFWHFPSSMFEPKPRWGVWLCCWEWKPPASSWCLRFPAQGPWTTAAGGGECSRRGIPSFGRLCSLCSIPDPESVHRRLPCINTLHAFFFFFLLGYHSSPSHARDNLFVLERFTTSVVFFSLKETRERKRGRKGRNRTVIRLVGF